MKAKLRCVKRIWNEAPHNAFTSLIRFNGEWICAFREAESHLSEDGRIRIITSRDGWQWSSAALLASGDTQFPDLRDPRLGRHPDGGLLLLGAGAFRRAASGLQSYAWRSGDGRRWSEPEPIGECDIWIWNMATEGADIYAVGYCEENEDADKTGVRLYHSRDGRSFRPLATIRQDAQVPTETALTFCDGQAIALARRECLPGKTTATSWCEGSSLLGTAFPPYTQWAWRDLGIHTGGPALIRIPDGRFIAAGRKREPQDHTALWELDIDQGSLRELITLPSANDSSYAGLVWHEGALWVSYYSSHEGRSAIYMAELQID